MIDATSADIVHFLGMAVDQKIADLVRETGVTEDDIRLIIELVGFNRASMIREATLLKNDRERDRVPRDLKR